MPGMTPSQVEALGRHVERQGVQVTRTKNGLLLRLPNQDTTMVHYTSSDVNQEHQIRRALKRAGIGMPQGTKGDGEIRKPLKRSKEAVRAILLEMGDPLDVSIKAVLDRAAEQGVQITSGAVSNVLAAWGYAPSGSRASRLYHRPFRTSLIETDGVLTVPDAAGGFTDPGATPEAVTVPEDAAPARQNGPDYLDLVGSKMIDPETMPDHLSLHDIRAVLSAVGMGVQLRVWPLEDPTERPPIVRELKPHREVNV